MLMIGLGTISPCRASPPPDSEPISLCMIGISGKSMGPGSPVPFDRNGVQMIEDTSYTGRNCFLNKCHGAMNLLLLCYSLEWFNKRYSIDFLDELMYNYGSLDELISLF